MSGGVTRESHPGIPQFWCLPFSIPYRIRLYGRFGPYRLPSVTVRASKKYLRLRLRHPRNRRPTVYVRPIPVTVRRAPLFKCRGIMYYTNVKRFALEAHGRKISTHEWEKGSDQRELLPTSKLLTKIGVSRKSYHLAVAVHASLYLFA